MTYQGERARAMPSESGRFFTISKVDLSPDGRVRQVLWAEVNAGSDLDTSAPVVAPVADVVDALHDGAEVAAVFSAPDPTSPVRLFVVLAHADGSESIALDGPPAPGRNLADVVRLEGATP